ncbi:MULTISPECIES: glycosyltransferase [Microbacterium]|uniref:Glycosyl transferase family 2 n=1 Tax=Microbacterium saccharophilum TaxID=1213358 RepID=A0A7Z7D1R2_9MICO|nr:MULTISPECIES: glycosyltransferase [Microbacterium]SFI76421.1 Glycosyl transferase family 2 [Microbacterium saccharophilum]
MNTPRPLRVLVAPHSMELGGSQINALELVEAMASDPRIELILYAPDGVLADRARRAGVQLHLTKLRENAVSALRMRELWSLARRVDADLVHTYEWMPTVDAAYSVVAGRGIPLLSTILSMDYPYLLPPAVPLVLGTRELTGRAIAEGRRAYLLEPPVDTGLFHPAARPYSEIAAARAECGAEADDTLVVVVGRLAQMLKLEGLLVLTETVGALAKNRNVRLAIVGDGDSRRLVASAAAQANAQAGREVVRLLGERMDPLPYYLAADVAVGMGGSALRAMAVGRPLLVQGEAGFWAVADEHSAPTFLKQGWYGVGDAPRSVERCTAELTRLLDASDDELAALGRFGRDLVTRNYSLTRAAATLADIYLSETTAARPTRGRRVREPARLTLELAKSALSVRLPGLRDVVRRATGRPPAERRTSKSQPTFSVVIPCYNYVDYIDDAIQSALNQEGVDVDVVVVDDASTDGSRARAEAWVRRDRRVRVVAHEANRGHIDTFNEALNSATGDFVVKLDADDVLTPGSLRRAADVLVRHPNVAFVYGGVEHVRGPLPTEIQMRARGVRVWEGEEWLMLVARHARNPISQPEVVIRRSALESAGGHRPEIPGTSDLHLWLSLATRGQVAHIRGAVQGLYRVHDASMRATIHSGALYDVHARRDAFELLLAERRASIKVADRFAATYRRALAADALFNAHLDIDAGRDPQPLLDLAMEIDPGLVGSRRWRAVQRRSQGDGGLRAFAGRTRRDVQSRLHWRRHRLWGV